MRVLRQRFGDGVRGEVFGDKVQSSFSEAIASEELRPAGMPEIEADIDKAARRYAYTAKFEVLPQIDLRGLEGKSIRRPVADVVDSDVDDMIARLREQNKEWVDVERPAANGDRVTASFQGSIDGESFPGGNAEDVPLVLGSNSMVPGFEEQLIGVSAGNERDIDVTFPDDYQKEELAGKQARFSVSVKAVAKPVLPDVDDAFVRRFGVEDGDLEKFRADVRSNMGRELKQRIESRLKEQVMDALIEANPIDLPAVLVNEEIKVLKGQARQAVGGGTFELPDELFSDSAKRRVALGLIVAEIVKQHELGPDADRVRAVVEEMAATFEAPQSVIDYYYADRQRLAQVESMVMEEMVVERMLEQADVVDEPITFASMTETQQTG
jgi:trigger factor